MRCHVCHTKIPLGEDICPNCGAKVESQSIYKNHIQRPSFKTMNYKKIKMVLFIVIIVVIVLMGTSDLYRYQNNKRVRTSSETSFTPFVELKDSDIYIEESELLIQAQDSLEDMKQYLKEHHITSVNDISYTKRIGYAINPVARLEFQKDNISYDMYESFASDDTFDEYIGFSIELNNLEEIDKETFLPKNEITLLENYFKLEGIYEDFNEARERILKEESNSVTYTSNQKEISVNKSFDEESKLISITFNVDVKS